MIPGWRESAVALAIICLLIINRLAPGRYLKPCSFGFLGFFLGRQISQGGEGIAYPSQQVNKNVRLPYSDHMYYVRLLQIGEQDTNGSGYIQHY
jgi:hypothetical protein